MVAESPSMIISLNQFLWQFEKLFTLLLDKSYHLVLSFSHYQMVLKLYQIIESWLSLSLSLSFDKPIGSAYKMVNVCANVERIGGQYIKAIEPKLLFLLLNLRSFSLNFFFSFFFFLFSHSFRLNLRSGFQLAQLVKSLMVV